MIIQILGTGCAKCKSLEANAIKAVSTLGIAAEVIKVSNMDEIMEMGVLMTPALAIDGEVKTLGKLLSPEQIQEIIKEAM